MKIKVLVSVMLTLFGFTKVYSLNIYPTSDTTKVIIAFLSEDNDQLLSLKKALKSDPLIEYVAFCSNHSVFVLKYNGDENSVSKKVGLLREKLMFDEKTFFIKQFGFGDIMDFCTFNINESGKKIK
jgi:hypothetical protein